MKVQTVSYKSKSASKDFTESLRVTGFGVLTDHPISYSLVQATFQDWAAFFKRADKFDYKFEKDSQSGFFPFKTENAKNSTVKDLKEFFHYFNWTEMPKGMSGNTRELFDRTQALAIELLGWIEENTPVNIRSQFSMPLSQMIQGSRETLLRPIHYPPLDGSEEPGAIRAAAHEDINLITILPAATAAGLQVLDNEGMWHDVECNPGALAINSGDMLKMASGNYYGSTTHRVVNPDGLKAGEPRYSMPLFLHPRHDVRLSKDYTAGTYLGERLGEIGLKK
ncbi:MAG: isopenicillin N synthase family oxygenase [Xanthomonadaceae bacterium]|nr:isopenicillin N synthase family oxygenase [Xanthomonadaceae bacterium]